VPPWTEEYRWRWRSRVLGLLGQRRQQLGELGSSRQGWSGSSSGSSLAADGGTGEWGTGVEGERLQQRSSGGGCAAPALRPSGLQSADGVAGRPGGIGKGG